MAADRARGAVRRCGAGAERAATPPSPSHCNRADPARGGARSAVRTPTPEPRRTKMTAVTTPRREQRGRAGRPHRRLAAACGARPVVPGSASRTPARRRSWSPCSSWPRWCWSAGCRCTAGRCSAPPTLNAPDNFTDDRPTTSWSGRRRWFTIKYTVIITVLLFVVVAGPGPAGAAPPARRRLLPHRVLPADGGRLRQRLAALPRPAQRRDRPGQRPAARRRADRRLRLVDQRQRQLRARLGGRAGALAVRGVQHADPADRSAGHPAGDLRGGPGRRRQPVADLPAGSPSR